MGILAFPQIHLFTILPKVPDTFELTIVSGGNSSDIVRVMKNIALQNFDESYHQNLLYHRRKINDFGHDSAIRISNFIG